ncbi:MAG: response regulator [Chitinivibrionales bacterium]|nr:response regulator [Chitinivibrionales bacterium]
MRILCVDDDQLFLTMYKKILEKILHPDDELLFAGDGEKAIDTVHNTAVDVIVTDLVMPGKSGLDVLEQAKAVRSSIEVIVVTGQASIDSAVEAMRLGARDYLTKPLNQGLLIEKIENLREFIDRAHEAEDYRFAKETIEVNAQRTIADLEISLDNYLRIVDDIKAVKERNASDSEKMKAITMILDKIVNAA